MYNDKQAQDAIIEAFRELDSMQIPLNSITIPDTAKSILSQNTKEKVDERIYNQINTMILNGTLVSTSNQVNTWKLTFFY
ncbi:MAG: hypothetical protein RLZZ384_344 [Pseudomonadota bacterium]|jgi:hypothetical protein